jgi:hypothetical protein
VPPPAVGLDGDPLAGEHEVDGEAGRELLVDERSREAVALAELEERDLEVRSRAGGAGLVGVEEPPEPRRTAVAGVGPGQGIEGGVGGELLDLRLVEGVLQPAVSDRGGEVEDGAGGRGDGDPFARGELARRQAGVAMDADAGAATARAAGHDDMGRPRGGALEIPEGAGRGVAEGGALAAREDGRHPPPADAKHRVPHRVHAGVHGMQPPRGDPPSDGSGSQPKRHELTAGDDPMLPGGEVSERLLGESCSDIEHFSPRSGHPPTMAPKPSQRTPETQRFTATAAAERTRRHPHPLAAAVRERQHPSTQAARRATQAKR